MSEVERSALEEETLLFLRDMPFVCSDDKRTRFLSCGCSWCTDEDVLELCSWHDGFNHGLRHRRTRQP